MTYRSYAEFARTKGAKDKGRRKSRAGMIAGGVAGAGAVGAGIRYGGAALKESGMKDQRGFKGGTRVLDTKYGGSSIVGGTPIRVGSIEDRARKAGTGLKSRVTRDSDYLTNAANPNRVRDIENLKQLPSRAKGSVKQALGKSTSNSKYLGKTLGGNIARGGGLLAAAGGTAAILSYLKNRKKKESTLKGKVRSVMNRFGK